MTISIDIEKALKKIYHASMVNILSKLGIQRNFLKFIRANYLKPIGNNILHDKKIECLPLKIENKKKLPTFIISS